MTNIIESTVATNNIVILKQGNLNKYLPLVLIHPMGGDVYFYRDLVKSLANEQTIYAVRSPMLNVQKTLSNIKEMAECYLQELEDYGIKPPYVVGGSSFGGIVAYQMAQILHNKGIDTPMVVLIDTPGHDKLPNSLMNSAEILAYLMSYKLDILEILVNELKDLENREGETQYIKDEANNLGHNDIISEEFGVNYVSTWKAHSEALFSYVPNHYSGHIVFFYPIEAMLPYLDTNQHLSWAKWAGEKFSVFPIPGNHISMNFKPNVKFIAQDLQLLIAETSNALSRM